jgi:hypothetical protein
MRRVIGLAFGLALGLAGAGAAHAQDSARFDGDWAVVLHCPHSSDGALPFTFGFIATVAGGTLHGANGVAGRPGWLSLDGPIQSSGDAALIANGLTGDSKYNIKQTQRGVPYRYPVSAHFEAASGTGQWVSRRVCVFTFTRE